VRSLLNRQLFNAINAAVKNIIVLNLYIYLSFISEGITNIEMIRHRYKVQFYLADFSQAGVKKGKEVFGYFQISNYFLRVTTCSYLSGCLPDAVGELTKIIIPFGDN